MASELIRRFGKNASWGLPLALLLFGLVRLLTSFCYRPPEPKPENAPAGEFSAGRARLQLRELIGDGSPHPVGSAANARTRERVLAGFRRIGYQPEVEQGFACSRRGRCAAVHNVMARLQGRRQGPAVLLCAHYDSVVSGPGAADDLASVAAMLEIARVLKGGPPPLNSVLFLADDGEEAGLLGAEVFVGGPRAREVAAVVNLEARGTSGASLMFQTNRDNGWLIPILARATIRPVTSSLFATIYERMPNDTDFTVFNHAGMQGLNFAFIGNQPHYHTPLDNFANASPASLQHQGDNALGAVHALAVADLRHPPRGAAVFFDVLGRWLIWWPANWALPLAAVALLLLATEALLLLRRRKLTGVALARGGIAFVAILFGSALAAIGLSLALRAVGAFRVNWVADPRPATAAFWLLALAVGGGVSALSARRAGVSGLWAGVWIGWALLGVLVAWSLPGASFLLVVPALGAGLAALPSMVVARSRDLSPGLLILPSIVTAVLWFPVASFLEDGLGTGGLYLVTLMVAVCVTTLAPLFAEPDRRLAGVVPVTAAAMVLVASGLAAAAPSFSRQSPQKIGVLYHEDADSGTARWLVLGDLPAPIAMRRAAPLKNQPIFPWSSSGETAESASAPGLGLPAPRLTVLVDTVVAGKRRLRLRLSSARGAPSATLILPRSARIESATVEGAPVPRLPDGSLAADGDWHFFTCETLPPQGIAIELVLARTAPLAAYVVDGSPDLVPLPSGLALVGARPDTAVSIGDWTLVSRRLSI
ncbi:MAG TPA: M28 family peptidase [Thermoanaerobaculia bacterium]|nr:M28 family peptidase [Thermoanaerobaculia bacterium]